jgi:putative membrane protein
MSISPSEVADGASPPRWILVLSAGVCAAVAFLILGPRPEGVAGAVDVSLLPWVNAAINSLTMLLLLAGFVAIRRKNVILHRRLMTASLACSAAFLVSYVIYHWFSAGPTLYEGPFRLGYLFMLLTHVVLAAVILPAALTTWWRGWSGQVASHRRVAPTTLAVWLYVTVTGVLITVLAHGGWSG